MSGRAGEDTEACTRLDRRTSDQAGRLGRAVVTARSRDRRRSRPSRWASPSPSCSSTRRAGLIGAAAPLLAFVLRGPRRRRPSAPVRRAGRRRRPHAGPPGGTCRGRLLRVRVRETRRLGVRSRTLELDTAAGPDDDGVLVVLGRRDLGADPEEVARALRAAGPDRRPLEVQHGQGRDGRSTRRAAAHRRDRQRGDLQPGRRRVSSDSPRPPRPRPARPGARAGRRPAGS